MKKLLIILLMFNVTVFLISCTNKKNNSEQPGIRTILVPKDFPTIAKAVENARDGDQIILSPGTYSEHNIVVNKSITISSEWKLTQNESKIDETIIDADDQILFTLKADSAAISGLKIINGNHSLNILANVSISHNHFVHNLDAMSYESTGGGYSGYNTVEDDRDDGIDLDISVSGSKHGSNILIEHNTIMNSDDDGIEIRLFNTPDQNIKYTIRENKISGSNNAGIQLISYDIFTGKEFSIHHNIIRGCKTGLGCMGGSNTKEDLTGASKMDEQVHFYNNTLIGNKMGATGGNNILALNNIVQGNELGGFKLFGKNSAVINNLFYQNGVSDTIEFNSAVIKSGNIFARDPLLDISTSVPATTSPCINAGKERYEINGVLILKIDSKYITGSIIDLGAIEYTGK